MALAVCLIAAAPSVRPVLIGPGTISLQDTDDHNFTITPDGSLAYFVRHNRQRYIWTVFESEFIRGRWTSATVAAWSGDWRDTDPFVSPDGSRLYFASARPLGGERKHDTDLWYMHWTPDGWDEPVHLDEPVSSTWDDTHPTVAANKNLYFCSARDTQLYGLEIYRSRWINGSYAPPEKIAELNTPDDDCDPAISPDESFMVFSRVSKGEYTGAELMLTRFQNGRWTQPRAIIKDALGGAARFPSISPDGRHLYYSRSDPEGNHDIYRVPVSALLTR